MEAIRAGSPKAVNQTGPHRETGSRSTEATEKRPSSARLVRMGPRCSSPSVALRFRRPGRKADEGPGGAQRLRAFRLLVFPVETTRWGCLGEGGPLPEGGPTD